MDKDKGNSRSRAAKRVRIPARLQVSRSARPARWVAKVSVGRMSSTSTMEVLCDPKALPAAHPRRARPRVWRIASLRPFGVDLAARAVEQLAPSSSSRQNISSAGVRTAPAVSPHERGRMSSCEPDAMSVWLGRAGVGRLKGAGLLAAADTAGGRVRSGGLLGVAQPMAAWCEARRMGRRRWMAGRRLVILVE